MKRNKYLKTVGDIKDRGKIKWTALMLPEHVEMIREWYEKDEKVLKPDLNEYDLQLLQEEMDIALKRQCEVLIHSWKDGVIHEHRGTIEGIDARSRMLIYGNQVEKHRLPMDEVVSIVTVE
ncbi:YolD-like family protein [uncultured Planococcus sp.]|uniref:YolD-like family protein n=1 Tax=Planococcus donghaensis TaxID=414778 RepID=UPI00262F77CF|nr:YolD-like family protein [uncultured Planococcus sp.]